MWCIMPSVPSWKSSVWPSSTQAMHHLIYLRTSKCKAFNLKKSKIAKPGTGERAVNGWLLVVWLCWSTLVCSLIPHQEIPIYFSLLFFQGGIFWLVVLVLVDFSPLCRIPQSLSLLLASVKLHRRSVSERPFFRQYEMRMSNGKDNNNLSQVRFEPTIFRL